MKALSVIEKLEFSIGGFDAPKFVVTYEKKAATYFASRYIYGSELEHKKVVSQDDLDKFVSIMSELRVLDWKNKYDSFNVLDGEQWELMIIYDRSKKKKIYGNNDYPDSHSSSTKRTPEFNKLLKAIKTLLKEPAFFSEAFIDKQTLTDKP